MNKFKCLLMLLLFFMFPMIINAEEKSINIYMFKGKTCPHCLAEKEFFTEYLEDKPNINLHEYEIWYNSANQKLLKKVQEKLNNHESGVPYTVIGDKVIVGFNEYNTKDLLINYIEKALQDPNYKDYISDLVDVDSEYYTEEKVQKNEIKETNEVVNNVDVPVLGNVNPTNVSLPLLSVILGFIDGFNPCAMWILIFLITMLFNMKDKKRMWILGLTFIITSGIVYLAFMLTWLNLATFISKLSIIRLLISIIAIIIGVWNLIKFSNSSKRSDGCDVVEKSDRKKIMSKIKSITSEKKFLIALISIMILAASVNVIELMCSIGIPLLFTQILSMNNLSIIEYSIYIFLYIFFFLIDDFIVFFIAMITSKITVFSTKYSKYSHLLGGIIMIIIGVLMLIKPEILLFNF